MRARAGLDEDSAERLGAELEELGALVSLVPSKALTLTMLDGASEPAPASAPAPAPAPAPGDPFHPENPDDRLELQVVDRRPGTMAEEPRPPEPEPEPVARAGRPPEHPPSAPSLRERLDDLRASPRARLVAGLAVGLLLGFVPAHIYALHAEDKLDEIRLDVARQPPPLTDAEYELALQAYDLARARLSRTKKRIAIVSGLVWLVAGGVVAAAFWRYVPDS